MVLEMKSCFSFHNTIQLYCAAIPAYVDAGKEKKSKKRIAT